MAISINIKEFCETRGVQYAGADVSSGYKLKIVCGLNSPTTANQLWNGDMDKIGLGTIEALCRGLGCEPNDLFAFDPPLKQTRAPVTHKHPRQKRKAKAAKQAEPKTALRLIS